MKNIIRRESKKRHTDRLMGRHTDQNGRTKKKQVRSTVDATYFDHVNVFNLVRLKKQKKSRIFFYKF